jgi:hypothetical protein
MVTYPRAVPARLCQAFAHGWRSAWGPAATLHGMALNRTIAAAAVAGVLGVGAAALTLPGGDDAAATAKPKVRTEVVHRTRHVRHRGHPAAAPAAAPAPVVTAPPPAPTAVVVRVDDDDDRFDDHGGHGRGHGDDDGDHSGHGHGGDDDD